MADNSPLLIERLMNKLEKGSCWAWTGNRHPGGYGLITFKRKQYRVHRAMWEIIFGKIPDGLCVCHRCDNRICSKPSHLFIGTRKDNLRDMRQKNRGAHGERHGNHILSWALVKKFRKLEGKISQSELARRYGLKRETVRYALKLGWKKEPNCPTKILEV